MRRLFLFLVSFFLLIGSGCASKPKIKKELIFKPQNPLQKISKSIKVKVKISKKEYQEQEKNILWQKALKKGLVTINRKILKEQLIVRPTNIGLNPEQILFSKSGDLKPIYSSYSNEYIQNFEINVELIPDFVLAGRVISLKENSYTIGEYEFCYIGIYHPLALEKNYFFIGKFSPQEDIVRIVGLGKIVQAIPESNVGKDKDKRYKLLVQGEIYEVQEEIEKGDLIFLPIIKVRAISEPVLGATTSQQEEIVVEPKYLEEPNLPKESK
ncbi:hypothetical protein [Desulfonauticus submarinus]